MDHLSSPETIAAVRRLVRQKAALTPAQMLLRGALAGGLLAYATSLVMVILSQGLPPLVGAICFPVGFVMLVLLGLELATGNFALMTIGLLSRDVGWKGLVRNWTWVYAGNLAGSVAYAALFCAAITSFGASSGGPIAEQVRRVAISKTTAYAALGVAGWGTAFIKAVLCNWMVTIGAVLALVSRSTIGKIVAMWIPIATFFAHGYEHSIVNMFVVPAGMFLRAPISAGSWWWWNQIPVTLGNMLAGVLLTGAGLAVCYPRSTTADVTADAQAA
jgi:formate/nitrite transporter